MTVPLESWFSDVLPLVPGCPMMVAKKAIVDSLREFCSRTQVWEHSVAPFPVVKGVADYRLMIPKDTEIAGFLSVYHKGRPRPLTLRSTRELDDQFPEWRTTTGLPSSFVQFNQNGLMLDRLPQKTERDVLSCTLALKPKSTTKEVADVLYADWKDGITYGAVKQLVIMPRKQWSAPELFDLYNNKFNIEVSRASVKARYGSGARSISVKMRRNY